MKTIRFISLALLVIIISISCTKKQELDITMNMIEDGDIELKFVDDSDVGIAAVAVRLESGYSSPIAEGYTDENGIIQFKDVLSGTYILEAEDILVNSVEYSVSQIVQVISGITKSYIIIPSDYSGTANISVIDFFEGTPVPVVNVGVFSSEDYHYTMETADVIAILKASGKTDSLGQIIFEKLPLKNYGTIVYADDQSSVLEQYSFQLYRKGIEEKVTITY